MVEILIEEFKGNDELLLGVLIHNGLVVMIAEVHVVGDGGSEWC